MRLIGIQQARYHDTMLCETLNEMQETLFFVFKIL